MSIFWIIIIGTIVVVAIRFNTDLSKDKDELNTQPLEMKFDMLLNMLNKEAFNGDGIITKHDNRSFNLYEQGSNQIIYFHYSTGHLTLTWKYKYLHKEVVHERQFNNVRNISLIDQQDIADKMIDEMREVVRRHKENVHDGNSNW
jgi:hypothetical protein